MSKLSTFIGAWGQKSMGGIICEWWVSQFPAPAVQPRPWSDEDQAAANSPDAIRVCHRCLTPQEHLGWFCPECGTATGPYNNCMPFVNVFSQGETFRAGINENIRFARWVYPAYFLAAFGALLMFAPFYWIRLFRAQKKRLLASPETTHDD